MCLLSAAAPINLALAQAASGAKVEAVYLGTREPDRVEETVQPASLLCRELVRQAILISARDERGLSTRDATLREELPKTSELHFAAFDLECKAVSQNTSALVYALSPRGDGEPKAVWEWKFPCDLNDPETIAKLAEECEHLSRGELKTVLERAGLGKSVPAARATAAVPVQAEEQLWEFNELGLLDGLRRIHEEIRSRGESPELLGALCVGYANLGSVTEYHFSAAHKAYSARCADLCRTALAKRQTVELGLVAPGVCSGPRGAASARARGCVECQRAAGKGCRLAARSLLDGSSRRVLPGPAAADGEGSDESEAGATGRLFKPRGCAVFRNGDLIVTAANEMVHKCPSVCEVGTPRGDTV